MRLNRRVENHLLRAENPVNGGKPLTGFILIVRSIGKIKKFTIKVSL